ncbi:hypothetical protein AAES_109604 [Amazona aestiva]|uniref:Uncharacterized protein n=1 Tax=Amazona aestiva TaxID=12930 RepID=A0A0Q3MHC3_AMAAE|nr:hypothetical protein AAES_109604 [Amazona aestiva]
MSWSMILRYSSAMLEITSPTWQTLELLMIFHKHSAPWESGLPKAKMMRHLDPAAGTADEEINKGAEEFEVKLDLWENWRSDGCSASAQGLSGPSLEDGDLPIVPSSGDSEDEMLLP